MIDKWIVYIIKCIDNTLYVGITNNLFLRLLKHNLNKGAKYTRGRGPVKLLKFIIINNKSEALKLEYKIKKLSKKTKLKLINESNLKILNNFI